MDLFVKIRALIALNRIDEALGVVDNFLESIPVKHQFIRNLFFPSTVSGVILRMCYLLVHCDHFLLIFGLFSKLDKLAKAVESDVDKKRRVRELIDTSSGKVFSVDLKEFLTRPIERRNKDQRGQRQEQDQTSGDYQGQRRTGDQFNRQPQQQQQQRTQQRGFFDRRPQQQKPG